MIYQVILKNNFKNYRDIIPAEIYFKAMKSMSLKPEEKSRTNTYHSTVKMYACLLACFLFDRS